MNFINFIFNFIKVINFIKEWIKMMNIILVIFLNYQKNRNTFLIMELIFLLIFLFIQIQYIILLVY